MSEEDIETEDYTGPDRRTLDKRRVKPDPRKDIRFDPSGGDRRSGFARREDDEGIHLDDDVDG